jgi:hypothetical protein
MTDQFTIARVSKLLADFKQKHGRDITTAELVAAGFAEGLINGLVKHGLLAKYQVVGKGGRRENRYKLAKDWRGLNN